ncbi:helix-turn-helix transcriptional regulator [Moorella naiadis]|uniref:helix-turn-helix domain-containing protein n=1 Tax=Moorella naiadis (nom. illeg.) TaxID=3093670 RepID=UPI003D9CB51B
MLGNRIKQKRLELGLTQEDVAKKIGVNRSTVSSWEIGRREPDGEILAKLANILQCSTDFLLRNKTSSLQQKDPVEENWPEVLQVLRRSGKKPTAQERKKIAKIIETAIEAITED